MSTTDLVPVLFEHVPHPHIERRRRLGAPKHADHAVGLNGRLALFVTAVIGTMWCAYLFTLLALLSAPAAFSSGSLLVIVAWIAQTFIQLVLLPIIIVGQNIAAKASDARADATYRDVEAILHELGQLEAHLAAQDAAR